MEECVRQEIDLNKEIILNAEEAGELFGVTKWAIYKKVKNDDLPHHKKGMRIYFVKRELVQYIMES
jgi:predicted DNA-binding transcriptional regulator AlpA